MKRRLAAQKKINKQAPILGKWLRVLFWLVLVQTVADVLQQDFVQNWLPWLKVTGDVIYITCSLAYGLIMIRMASVTMCYRTAGACYIVSILMTLMEYLLPDDSGLIVVLSLVSMPVALVARYNEYMGHSYALEDIDNDLSATWAGLWKWFIGLYAAMFVSIIFSAFGILLLVLVLLGLLVLGIYATVLLYRTAKLFKDYQIYHTHST